MSDDFFYALITGWGVLALFWAIIIIFILIRKPPNSRLTKKTIITSILFFLSLFLFIYLIEHTIRFFNKFSNYI